MAEKRYYWIKMYTDFFESFRVKQLRGKDKGDSLLIYYLMLLAKAVNNDGVIQFRDLDCAVESEIAVDIGADVDDVVALTSYLVKAGMAERLRDGSLYLPYAVKNVGSETDSAIRQRTSRTKNLQNFNKKRDNVTDLCDNVTDLCDNVTDLCDNVTQEKRREDKKREDKRGRAGAHTHTRTRGKHLNVIITDSESEALVRRYGDGCAGRLIDNLSDYLHQHPDKHYAHHYDLICRWADEDAKRNGLSSFDTDQFFAAACKFAEEG